MIHDSMSTLDNLSWIHESYVMPADPILELTEHAWK